jgi:hypothetical protein
MRIKQSAAKGQCGESFVGDDGEQEDEPRLERARGALGEALENGVEGEREEEHQRRRHWHVLPQPMKVLRGVLAGHLLQPA